MFCGQDVRVTKRCQPQDHGKGWQLNGKHTELEFEIDTQSLSSIKYLLEMGKTDTETELGHKT